MSLWGNPVGAAMGHVLHLSGGTMSGGINMNKNVLNGLKIPESDDQAANRKYVVDSVSVATAAAAGAQSTANSAVTAAGNAASAASAAAGAAANAQSTANSKALKVPFTAQLTASGWTGDTAPYTQTVALEGILAEDDPYYGPVYSGDVSQRIQERTAFGCIDDLDTAENSVTFTCFENKPVTDLTVQMEVFR